MKKPQPYHGLEQLAARRGWRSLDDVRRGDVYLSERTVFRDTSTGCIAWRMTSDPAVDVDDYYDIPSWNADGSVMSFLSWRSGAKMRWLMDANGANIRPMPTPPDGRQIETGYWSVIHRDRFYYPVVDETGTHVMALNPFSGEVQEIVSVDRDLGRMMPPHPKEEHFLFGKHQDRPGQTQVFNPEITDEASWIYVLSLDGEVQEIELERRWHRLRFTKADDLRIFFNYDNPRTQYTILPDGSERQEIPHTGGHPDWPVGGGELTYYAEGAIWGVQPDGSERREVIRLGSGGHGGPTRDGTYFVSDTHGGKEPRFPDAIVYLRTDGSGVAHPLFRPQSSFYAHTQLWHPDHHSTHPHPVASPDGTKALFNSDMIGEFSDVYIAVTRPPDPPRDLVARLDGRSVVLNWKEPVRARELRGYNVYRYDEDTLSWKQLTYIPQRGTGWRGPQRKAPAYYVVTAVEHSGLESRPSNQIYQLGNEFWEGHVRFTYEAEAGEMVLPVREFVDMEGASGLYCIGAHEGQAGGSVTFALDLPASVKYRVWGRVRGQGAWSATLDDKEAGALPAAGDEWTWVALAETPLLMSGSHTLVLAPTTGGEFLDKVFVTDDLEMTPEGLMGLDTSAPDTPADVQVEPVSSNTLRLWWTALKVNDLDHYNVYCADTSEFEPSQATLVGSPSEVEFVDWGLEPGRSYWYKVTAVDRHGNESGPGEVIEGVLPEIAMPVRITLEARKAKRHNMEIIDSSAAGGRVLTPGLKEEEPTAEWRFRVPADGVYALWGRTVHQREQPTAYTIVLDGEAVGEWKVYGRWGQWVWSPLGDKTSGSPTLFRLSQGNHDLRLIAHTPTSRVAEVVVTNDPTWWPLEGYRGENMAV